ncbi:MAG: iron ABC transporter permease [Clostridia bacterium]|nr:iron ABC transporter permease [Clostridia bacterium]
MFALFNGDEYQIKIFLNLRLSRVIVGLLGGFALGIAGFVFQTIFHNPLAAPDIIGVSSGASAGAAAGILFLGSSFAITLCAFGGSLLAILLAIVLSMVDKTNNKNSIVLSGIVVHALAQTVLMFLKIAADPERQLASIEYWIMGSLNGVNLGLARINLVIAIICIIAAFLLHRQIILLSADESEAKMLGVNVNKIRLTCLVITTLMVSSVISMTGLISFIGLIAPHCARLLSKRNDSKTMLLGGIIGALLLCFADILARSLTTAELPVSIFTSLIGAPFLAFLVLRRQK